MNIADEGLNISGNITDVTAQGRTFGGNFAGTISNFVEQNKPLVIGGILVGAFLFLSGYGRGVTNKIKKVKNSIKKKL